MQLACIDQHSEITDSQFEIEHAERQRLFPALDALQTAAEALWNARAARHRGDCSSLSSFFFFLLFNCRLPHRRMQLLEQQVNSSKPAFHLFKEEKMMNGTAADKMEEEASFGCLEQQS